MDLVSTFGVFVFYAQLTMGLKEEMIYMVMEVWDE